MNAVFADSFYFIALLSKADQAHQLAEEATQSLTGQMITTTAVLTEVADGLTAERARSDFAVSGPSFVS